MTYPPQPGQYPPAPGYPQYAQPPLPAPPAVDAPLNIVEPTGGGEWAPTPRHLIGRAVIGVPRFYDASNQFQGQSRPSVTVDFIVASIGPDGTPVGPLEFGDSQARDGTARPNCFRVDDMVAEFTGARWNNQVIVEYIAPLVGQGALFMGRIVQGTSQNRPPLINALDEGDAARQVLIEAWRQRTANPGSLKRTPIEINGGPPKKAEGAAGTVPPAQPTYGTGYPSQPGYGGPPPPPGAQVQYAQPAPAPVPPAALAQGWTPETWAQAPPPVRHAYGAQ